MSEEFEVDDDINPDPIDPDDAVVAAEASSGVSWVDGASVLGEETAIAAATWADLYDVTRRLADAEAESRTASAAFVAAGERWAAAQKSEADLYQEMREVSRLLRRQMVPLPEARP